MAAPFSRSNGFLLGRLLVSSSIVGCMRCFHGSFSKSYMHRIRKYPTHVWKRNTILYNKRIEATYCSTSPKSDGNDIPKRMVSERNNRRLKDGPSLEHFLANSAISNQEHTLGADYHEEEIPYLTKTTCNDKRKVYFETYGCQMNVNDTEIAWSILKKNGFTKTNDILQSDVILVMTCAIREGAETKIWNRLEYLKHLKKKRKQDPANPPLKIGILGCMAERLKKQIVEREKMVDIVCGPDAYRDLPRMLTLTESGQAAVNVLLSLDETYGDVMPVRLNTDSPSAFVSIMRGCDNMCTYCIVPFTRGRERSRPMASILDEVRSLSDQGIKEITLLGQNVNSYRDVSEIEYFQSESTSMSRGFNTVYKPKKGGLRFSDLLDKVSLIDPEMRIRFTSPHPKDFPDEVLHLIKERKNICNQIHLPAQSGHTDMLAAMRRGYTREAYIQLVQHIKDVIPDVALSSDFIAGFCGETEEMHQDTVSLLKLVKYNFAFCFPYSMRQKTRAYHRLEDNVPPDVKRRRHEELVQVFREEAEKLNQSQVGQIQAVLVEGDSKRSTNYMAGRNDYNTRIIIPKIEIPTAIEGSSLRPFKRGDYIGVQITSATSQVLKGQPLFHTTLQDFTNTGISSELSRKITMSAV